MSSTELFRKHFGSEIGSVDLKHPNTEKFFSELNEECLLEDKQKQCNHSWVYKILYNHTAKNVCEKCHLVVSQ
jgi:hypothetical protein